MTKITSAAKPRQRVVWGESALHEARAKLQWACTEYGRLKSQPTKNPFQAAKEWMQVAEALLAYGALQGELTDSFLHALEAFENGTYANSGRPWTAEEDNALVEAKVKDKSLIKTSLILHRSPLACTTRLSELVGIQREVTSVTGKRVQGLLDEDHVDGTFTGKIFHK